MELLSPAFNLEAAAICFLRWDKRCEIVCTEAGPFYSDVIGISGTDLYEIEIKRSRQDFVADFNKPKHEHYRNTNARYQERSPNYFYFMVPENLAAFAVEKAAKGGQYAGNQKYGVLSHDLESLGRWGISSAKKGYRIHSGKVSDRIKSELMFRMGTELINLYLFNGMIGRSADKLAREIRDADKRTFGLEDSQRDEFMSGTESDDFERKLAEGTEMTANFEETL